ncbi:branched-chain amino acid ABC transporter permease [Massilia niabensis]|uniref:Branched-chain amino acid ABC transporter permease n=1 Tax=Massilia niabensis TaxID=544910 RepID=A0ABW0L2I3_9BURK
MIELPSAQALPVSPRPPISRKPALATLLLAALLVAFPLVADSFGLDYYVGVVRRIVIFALLVTSLNLVLGYGGLVALGHAGFVGVGAYTVVVLDSIGITSVATAWPAAIVAGAMAALAIGTISLRTRGVYFIMITLAFAQMLYYVFASLRNYGGDDGYTLSARPSMLGGGESLEENGLYWLVLTLCALAFWLFSRITVSRFGHALGGTRDNEKRMHALGYPVYRLRLLAFTLAGALAGLGGAMLAANNSFVSPSMMHWTQSATLIVMLIIGGVGRIWGGVLGAVVWLVLEEWLKLQTEYWHMPLGLLLIVIALFLPRGLAALRWPNPGRTRTKKEGAE